MKAHSAFHSYSLGNQLLALMQCQMRGLQPGPINTFPKWKELGAEWMSATQLAEYWHLRNEKGEPTVAGIIKWAKRPPNQFPLPHAYMGDLLRFNRDEANQWAKEEASPQRKAALKKRDTDQIKN